MKAEKIHDQPHPLFVDWQREYQHLQNDHQYLKNDYHHLKDDHQHLKINYENLEIENAHLLQKLKLFHNALFAPKSEKISAELRQQLSLTFNEAETFATAEQEKIGFCRIC